MLVTAEHLKKICPNTAEYRLKVIEACLNFTAVDFPGLYDLRVMEEFLPQLVHESGAFRIREESGNYSAKRIVEVFPKYFKTLAEAQPYANNPKKLFNRTYANRMGNGAEDSGDGYLFRGRGFMQMTGRDMYTAYAKYINKPVEEAARLVGEEDYFAMHSACWLFAVVKKLVPSALADDFDRITYKINGGYNGKEDRDRLYSITKRVLRG